MSCRFGSSAASLAIVASGIGAPPKRAIRQDDRSNAENIRLQQAKMVHRRHHADDGDPLGGHQLEEPPRLEGRASGPCCRRHGASSAAFATSPMTWFAGVARSARSVAPEAEAERIVRDRMRDVEVGQHRALGPSGGARGVEDHRHVLLGRTVDRAARPCAGSPRAAHRRCGLRPRSDAPAAAGRQDRAGEGQAPPRGSGACCRSAPACRRGRPAARGC